MELTGIQKMLADTRYPREEPPADRRKPRVFSSANPTESPEMPYPVDFCIWLQSEGFGNNRRALIEACGGTWLAC
jgi:hypothetical protein